MANVEWGEFKIGDLFTKIKVNKIKYKASELPNRPNNDFILPALTAGIQNQGLNNFVPKDSATILKDVISISANGANTGATFYQKEEFTVLQDAYAIRWKFTDNLLQDNHYLYLTTSISKTIYDKYEWTNKAGWERVKNEKIQLPTKKNKVNFDFMDSFIIALEKERITKLQNYLSAANLTDYSLTAKEQQALDNFEQAEFQEFKVTDIFNINNSKSILSRDIIENSGTTPYLCASADNNAVSSYISYDKKHLDTGNCVFIGGKTFVVTYQEYDFYSNDSHNLILHLKDVKKHKSNQLYLATCIKKGLSHKYSWGDSISNKKIQKDVISLPIKDKKPDYAIMETLISAIQKLVIKDVVLYVNDKMQTRCSLNQSDNLPKVSQP